VSLNKQLEISEVWRKCPSRIYSSAQLGWKGIVVERHLAQPGEQPETTTQYYIVELANGWGSYYGEHAGRQGCFLPYIRPQQGINIYVGGVLPRIYTSSHTELVVCALKPDFVAEIADEQEGFVTSTLREVIGFHDEGTARLIHLLDEEARTGGQMGRLYAEHLIHAFTHRLLLTDTAKKVSARSIASDASRLLGVLERMRSDFSMDLDLLSLAKESGYSKSHFLRIFRDTMGITPHQYLLRLRVQQAQRMIEEKPCGLVDVALACGFSSHTHMSRMFRQLIGVTPSEYRRGIS
jgi:AraC family transcriptional regulator